MLTEIQYIQGVKALHDPLTASFRSFICYYLIIEFRI